MAATRRTIARAEPVGSLFRPPEITRRIHEIYRGLTSASPPFVLPEKAAELAELNRLADGVVPELVRRQVDAGMDVVTDGEIRRSTFLGSFYDAVAGMRLPDEPWGIKDEDGNFVYGGHFADPVVAERVRKARNPLADEAAVLRQVEAPVPFKLTMPPPSYFMCGLVETPPSSAYASRREFVDDVVEIERELIAEAIAAGATWIQFDIGLYSMLTTEDYTARLLELNGGAFDEVLSRALEVDNRVLEGMTGDVTFGMHLCHGNMPQSTAKGSIEAVAERMFHELPYDRFLLEWDDPERFGDFLPLRFVPEGKVVVLGLVSTKTPRLEAEDDIVRRIEDATRFAPVERLALSPQCGFASLPEDRHVESEEQQWRKLELVGRVADRVWGRR